MKQKSHRVASLSTASLLPCCGLSSCPVERRLFFIFFFFMPQVASCASFRFRCSAWRHRFRLFAAFLPAGLYKSVLDCLSWVGSGHLAYGACSSSPSAHSPYVYIYIYVRIFLYRRLLIIALLGSSMNAFGAPFAGGRGSQPKTLATALL